MVQYGLIGAGAVSRSLISRLPAKTQELGPVTASSFRVASRIANSLRAGTAARSAAELYRVPAVLFCANGGSAGELVRLLREVKFDWAGRCIVVCDSEIELRHFDSFRSGGASVASVAQLHLPGRYLVQGDPDAVKVARGIVRKLDGRVIFLGGEDAALFQAGITMGTALLTPLLERTAQVFRKAGLRDKQAAELASAVFERTARGFRHSGRQSWAWHLRGPNTDKLRAEMEALQSTTDFGEEFYRDLAAALASFGRHADALARLNEPSATGGTAAG